MPVGDSASEVCGCHGQQELESEEDSNSECLCLQGKYEVGPWFLLVGAQESNLAVIRWVETQRAMLSTQDTDYLPQPV